MKLGSDELNFVNEYCYFKSHGYRGGPFNTWGGGYVFSAKIMKINSLFSSLWEQIVCSCKMTEGYFLIASNAEK